MGTRRLHYSHFARKEALLFAGEWQYCYLYSFFKRSNQSINRYRYHRSGLGPGEAAVSDGTSKNTGRVNWHEYLPPSFKWIEQCAVQCGIPHQGKAHYLLTYQLETQGSDKSIVCDAKFLSDETKQSLLSMAKEMGLQHKEGIFTLSHGGNPYTFVAKSAIATSKPQKSAQIGLDFASYLKGWQGLPLVICAGKDSAALDIFAGLCQGLYQLSSFKGKNQKAGINFPERVFLWEEESLASNEEIARTRAMAQALTITRMIEDAPPNWLNSEKFAEIALDMAKTCNISCTVKGREEIKALGMGAFYSVGQASAFDPKLICLEIKGKDKNSTIALVGKGLTFDAGGVSLKPGLGMAEMKYDMCGGASVLGSAYYLSKVTPACNVVCVIGAVENVISATATRPGDIVRAMNGKTIEILNTDAEGRLVLADLLHYVIEGWQPKLVIDVATLTGAVVISLGGCGAGLLSNNDAAAAKVLEKSAMVGEPLWRLPMWPELAAEVASPFADLQNITSPRVKAGTLTAACFLNEFVGETPWVHLDIAGTGWDCQAVGYPRSGASGFSVRTLTKVCVEG
jgi:leucyl aminopeptidase